MQQLSKVDDEAVASKEDYEAVAFKVDDKAVPSKVDDEAVASKGDYEAAAHLGSVSSFGALGVGGHDGGTGLIRCSGRCICRSCCLGGLTVGGALLEQRHLMICQLNSSLQPVRSMSLMASANLHSKRDGAHSRSLRFAHPAKQ